MKTTKILRIIARLNIGGPAIHTILLTKGLDKARFKTLLVCGSISSDEGNMVYYARERQVEPYFIPELKRELNFFHDLVALKKIYQVIKKEQPDIIHTHTAKAGTLGRLAGILYSLFAKRKPKLIHTFHGHIFEGYFNQIQTQIFLLIERFLAQFSAKIITVSQTLKKELVSLGICAENKIEVVPLGLELDSLLDMSAKDKDDLLNIGIVGRLVPVKNHRLFLEAAALVVKDNPGIKLRFKIIGDGQLRKGLEEYATRLGISEKVDFLGWQKDLIEVYADLDIVALTSLNEGTPVSLIEAMACARPVVATDVGAVADLLGGALNHPPQPKGNFRVLERGIIVKSQDVFAFAQALSFLLQNKELRRNLGLAARVFVRDRFRKERLIKDIESLYLNLLSSASPPEITPAREKII